MDPGQKFREGKGFYDVIVGAAFQANHFIGQFSQGGQEDHRSEISFGPDFFEKGNSVHARHHSVQEDQIVGILPDPGKSIFAVAADVYLESFFF